jgi:glycosyltransferase involved in cell wall biosynthesis
MKICIDARPIGQKMHGIARYTYNMIKNLLKIDQQNQYTILIGKDFPGIPGKANNLRMMTLRSRWISISEQWELVKILKELKPDLFLATSFVAPVFNPFPMVMTIHDLNHIALSRNYSIFHAIYYKWVVKPAVKKSVKIVTVSEFSRKEISRYLMVPDEKIKVVYNGCGEEFRPIEDSKLLERVRKKYNFPETFILYVGSYKSHKNVSNLLKAYDRVSLKIPLVLSGRGSQELLELSKKFEMGKKIIFMGEVDESDLPIIYNCATLFVFPSYYEGFGLPPLEAMACGCPVVVSNAASLPEVCGDAAYYVDPRNVESISEGIYRVLTDENLRNTLILKGLERIKLFSWEKAAKEVLNVFDEILK